MRAVLALLLNILRLPFLPLWWLGRLLGRPRGEWVVFRIRPRLVEFPRPRPFFVKYLPGLVRVLPTPLSLVRRTAERILEDGKVRGAVFILPPLTAGWATCHALRDVLVGLREGGKEVVVHLPRGGGNREIFVASAAHRLYLGREATVMALGLSIEARYLKPLLDRVGVRVEAFARGEYKTAAETAVRDTMSEAQREQLGAVLAAIDREMVSGLLPRFGGEEARVRQLFDRGFLRGEAAVEMGLADATAYEDELPALLSEGGSPARLVRAPRYLTHRDGRFFHRVLPRPHIAVVELTGVIAEEAPALGTRGVDLDSAVRTLRAVRNDKRAVGVVLRVDSPGGSATASDLIHREVLRLRERKPVVASFGNVAASGGYYVAAPAHLIVAHPVSITGSIGVVSARLLARELLDRIGVRTETLRTAPHADMFSVARELEQDERAIIERELDGFYQAFVDVVARGRNRSAEDIDRVARGRVWAASDAVEHGLVDRMAGMEGALAEVRARLPVPAAAARLVEPRVVHAPRGEPPTPEPPAAPARDAARALLTDLAPGAAALLNLATGPDPVLYYAPDVPTVH